VVKYTLKKIMLILEKKVPINMDHKNMDDVKILETAKTAALKAGKYLAENYGNVKQPDVEFKGEINLVTKHDKKSQGIIHNIIEKEFPHHSILAEEDLEIQKEKDTLWLIDPLDGTTNFTYSLPIFSVSIALLEKGVPYIGVVYAPLLNELFHAVKGKGAFLNNKRISVSKETDLGKSILGTGFPYDVRESKVNNLEHFSRFIVKARAIRRMGSAAIDLAYTAAGRFDGFWELKLHPWDTAAAVLLVQEAGGKVTDFKGNPFNPFMKEVLASNGSIHDHMLQILS